jgi:hypothetical protein
VRIIVIDFAGRGGRLNDLYVSIIIIMSSTPQLRTLDRRTLCLKQTGTDEVTDDTSTGIGSVGTVDTSVGVKTVGALVCNNMQKLRRVELRDYALAMKKKRAELAKSSASTPIVTFPIPVPAQCASKVEVTVVANVTKPDPSAVASFYESISSDPNYIYAAVILLTLLLVLLYTILCSD